ncbi:MAG: type I-U CRISPR-associated helicase/endonuclease Cas3, partial [Myxococcota bacterium]
MALNTKDFDRFFHELWGYPPFPWQRRLLERVHADGWPDTLDLPTGSGKTAALEIGCFALALDAARPVADRKHPRRIALVIDRRVVVDQGYERARTIANRLAEASEGVLAEVRNALLSLHSGLGSDRPVAVAALRGGMVRDDDWARAPDQPLLLVSTVDQVGSRLLFRGYGISDRMAPVHAGILGSDTLYLLDEVHLSRPFEQTLSSVGQFANSELIERRVTRPPVVVRMSATVNDRGGERFGLDADDLSNETLSKRIKAAKPARLLEPVAVPADPAKAYAKVAKTCVEQARKLLEAEACEAAALIVNRVDTARMAAQLASDAKWVERAGVQVVLLTGRMRPLDREDVQVEVLHRIAAGRDRGTGGKLLLVSTQAIEAGADFDFDALVTECASLDALRQRFGRLDRRGHLSTAPAVIVASDRAVAEGADDPVYGPALASAWAWLQERAGEDGVVDFGIAAQRELHEPSDEVLTPPESAPALLPAYLDAWAQTAPKPDVEPDLSVFLHGPRREVADVQLVWRADLSPEALVDDEGVDELRLILSACPPSALEAVAVPVWSVRDWLRAVEARRTGSDAVAGPGFADVEGESAPEMPSEAAGRPFAPAVVWKGEDTHIARSPSAVRAGMTLVVPSSYGGLWRSNWDPSAIAPVVDRGDEAQLRHRGRAVLRWEPAVLAGWLPMGSPSLKVDDAEIDEHGDRVLVETFQAWVDLLDLSNIPPWARLTLRELRRRRPRFAEAERVWDPSADGDSKPKKWRAAWASRRISVAKLRELDRDAEQSRAIEWTEGDDGSFASVYVTLREHVEGVRDAAARLARCSGLPEPLVEDLALAGWLHDLGKADPRFQSMLLGGDEVRLAMTEEPLAKSEIPFFDRAARARARERSGYPKRTRHELMSVALSQAHEGIRARAHDWDLVLHLVASHHGYCRPLGPVAEDRQPVAVAVQIDGDKLSARSDHDLARLDSG